MSLWTAIAAKRALTPEQRQLFETAQIQGAHPAGGWLKLAQGVLSCQRLYEQARLWPLLRVPLFAFFGALGVSIFVPSAAIVTAPAAFLLLPGIFVAWIALARMRGRSLPEHAAKVLPGFVIPLLAILGEESQKGARLQLQLDLRGGTEAAKLKTKAATGDIYQDPWLSGQTTLADGAALGFRVLDRVRKRTVVKRSRSGKRKTKVRIKIKRLVSVRLGVPSKRYVVKKGPRTSPWRLSIKSGPRRHHVQVRRVEPLSVGSMPAGQFQSLDIKLLADLVGQAYRQVSRARDRGA